MNSPAFNAPDDVDYQARCAELEETVARMTRINEALMDRVERFRGNGRSENVVRLTLLKK